MKTGKGENEQQYAYTPLNNNKKLGESCACFMR